MAEDQCDRCIMPTPAVVTVVCTYGCRHRQCEECAAHTRREVEMDAFWNTQGQASGV